MLLHVVKNFNCNRMGKEIVSVSLHFTTYLCGFIESILLSKGNK